MNPPPGAVARLELLLLSRHAVVQLKLHLGIVLRCSWRPGGVCVRSHRSRSDGAPAQDPGAAGDGPWHQWPGTVSQDVPLLHGASRAAARASIADQGGVYLRRGGSPCGCESTGHG